MLCKTTKVAILAVGFSLSLSPLVKGEITFYGIGFTPDTVTSIANEVSSDGSVVVGSTLGSDRNQRAVRWTKEFGLEDIGEGWAIDVSANGQVIVGSIAETQSFRWTRDGGFEFVEEPAESEGSGVMAISPDGQFIVGYFYLKPNGVYSPRPILWTPTGFVLLTAEFDDGNASGRPYGISGDGSTVIMNIPAGAPYYNLPLVWTAAAGIQEFPIHGAELHAISADGTTISGYVDGEVFRWRQEAGIEVLFEDYGNVYDMTPNGDLVVGSVNTDEGPRARLWDEHGVTYDLNDFLPEVFSEWIVAEARGISADGNTVVGESTNPEGQREGFVMTGVASYLAELPASEFIGFPDPENDGWVNTGAGFLGWIYYIESGDHGWAHKQGVGWIYFASADSAGAWFYLPR